jgi:hypothetical protein
MTISDLIARFERDSTDYIELNAYDDDTSATLLRAAVSAAMNDGNLDKPFGLETFTLDEIYFIDSNLFPS